MLIVDTGPLIATDRDPDHRSCRGLIETHPGPLTTTALVIAEAGRMIRRQLGTAAETTLYRAITAGEQRPLTTPKLIGAGDDRAFGSIDPGMVVIVSPI